MATAMPRDPLRVRLFGFWSGIAAFAVLLSVPPIGGLSEAAGRLLALIALMAIWWLTEAIPVAMTGAMPFLILPLVGVAPADRVAAQYMSPAIFLILGSACIALALEKYALHRRLAYAVLRSAGATPQQLLLAIIASTAFVSMWINNSATTVMMLPIAMSVALASAPRLRAPAVPEAERRFAAAMALGVAWGANVGGLATLVGTPVNLVAVNSLATTLGVQVSFAEWLGFGLPLAIAGVPLGWWVLRATVMPRVIDRAPLADVLAALGEPQPLRSAEWRVLSVLLAAIGCWFALPWLAEYLPGINDATIAIAAAVALSVLPAGRRGEHGRLLEWPDVLRAPWYLVFLLGGGLALADAAVQTGLAGAIGASLDDLAARPVWQVLPIVAALLIGVTEFASNIATAAAFVPVVIALASAGNHDAVLFALTAGVASSWGFANPAGTSSNAMAYATGFVRVAEMVRAGLLFDLLGAVLIASVTAVFVPLIVS
ncbi:MAG: DASS family sodium-coupled anion symporter [Steroidobacteraceae bacterium]|nr:DASS family sodium-coupled anion symporter [Steroidobacteraceae bacterium]MDW8258371.1 DASS family sodium-coupled anion symporter [Gammaproteobacteria bacterium]